MSYATQTDLLKLVPESELIRLTDDDNQGIVGTAVVTWALDTATNMINAYIPSDSGFSIPLSTVPAFIRDICVVLAKVNLFDRRRLPIDESTKRMYDSALDILKKIANKTISLTTGGQVQATQNPGGEVDSEDRVFTRDELDGM